MRKISIIIVLLAMLVMGSGCSNNKDNVSMPNGLEAPNGMDYSTNEEYLNLLSDDTKLSFLVDGDYFEVPFPVAKLVEAGWTVDADPLNSITIESYQDELVWFSKGNVGIDVRVYNATEQTITADEGDVYYVTISTYAEPRDFMDTVLIKGGIGLYTSAYTASEKLVFEGDETYGTFYLDETKNRYCLFEYMNGLIYKIVFADFNLPVEEPIETPVDDNQTPTTPVTPVVDPSEEYKKKAEKNTNVYSGNIGRINGSLLAGNIKPGTAFHISGEVVDIVLVIGAGTVVNIIKTSDGEYFGLDSKDVKLPVGSQVEFWGTTTRTYLKSSEDYPGMGVFTPVIVNVDGTEIYNTIKD